MIFIEKLFIYLLILFSTLSSCKKEVELDQLTVSTFELYNPEQHDMNQNGLFLLIELLILIKKFVTLFVLIITHTINSKF